MKYNVDDNQSSIKTHFIVLPQKRGQVGSENTGNNCFDHLQRRSIQPQPPGDYLNSYKILLRIYQNKHFP